MSIVKLRSAGFLGLDVFPVEVQVDISPGLPFFNIVGLPDTAVKEAKERVRSAIKNAGFSFPNRRITVNLSPSDKKKLGSHYDLPIALGILKASGKADIPENFIYFGELSLDGSINKVSGLLAMVLTLYRKGFRKFFVPFHNLGELELMPPDTEIYTAEGLKELVEEGFKRIRPTKGVQNRKTTYKVDLSDVKGQKLAKRALEIAAAGFHHFAMVGAPGSGKSMLAKRLPTIMPPMEEWEILEVSQIYSVAGLLDNGLITERPFRAPHYTASETSIVGGGTYPKPGEISLAHRGVLFTDELPEFSRKVLEVLRQPLEDGEVLISRAGYKVKFPSKFLWISALNPCPCGNYKHPYRECVCKPNQIRKYLGKISSPLWERIDLKVWVQPVDYEKLFNRNEEETSEEVRNRVLEAVEIQRKRNPNGKLNGELNGRELQKVVKMDEPEKGFLEKAVTSFGLSARQYHKLLKVCRTIADLDGEEKIKKHHIAEALNLIREPLELIN
jgi:magnesium chelatase family protein